MASACAPLPTASSSTLEPCARAIDSAKARGIEAILEIGRQLRIAHDELANHGDGAFGRWVKERCGLSRMTAHNYMSVADAFPEDRKTDLRLFDASALYLLARDDSPNEAATDALKLAESGEHITKAKARELVDRHTARQTQELNEFLADGQEDEPEATQEPEPEPPVAGRIWDLATCIVEVRQTVVRWATGCPEDLRGDLADLLRSLATQIEGGKFS